MLTFGYLGLRQVAAGQRCFRIEDYVASTHGGLVNFLHLGSVRPHANHLQDTTVRLAMKEPAPTTTQQAAKRKTYVSSTRKPLPLQNWLRCIGGTDDNI